MAVQEFFPAPRSVTYEACRARPNAWREVILDIFSRYVVGWLVAHAESAPLAQLVSKL